MKHQKTTKKSLSEGNPSLAGEWHPNKNELALNDVTCGSNRKVWWLCPKGHEWEATVKSRSYGAGCPFCAGKMATADNCLETVMPALAKEWHPKKNSLFPKQVTPGSRKKVWWRCVKGHEWVARVTDRSDGTGCPYCSGRLVSKDNCLAKVNPSLAREWHPTKNAFSPRDVTPGSDRRVWWICRKGHEWETTVNSRSHGTGCPRCASQKFKRMFY
jgi:hypothetical protein